MLNPASAKCPLVSAILNSPPLLCEITILFAVSTLAETFVKPALLIAPAITSASVAAPVAVALIATALFKAALPTIDSWMLNVTAPAETCVVIALPVIVVAPVAFLLYTLKFLFSQNEKYLD